MKQITHKTLTCRNSRIELDKCKTHYHNLCERVAISLSGCKYKTYLQSDKKKIEYF
jgi:hypothetical protein